VLLGEQRTDEPHDRGPVGAHRKLTLYFNDSSSEDLWIAITWGKAP
jgi:hypothetical protein